MARIASYAGLVFEVSEKKMLSFQNMSLSRGINYEEHPRAKKQPYMEFTSKQNATMRLTVIAKRSLGASPRKIWEKLAKIRDGHKAAYFYLGESNSGTQKKVGKERWVITSISNDFKAFNVRGNPVDMSFDIELKEYPHKKAKSTKASNKTKPKNEKKKTETTVKKKNYTLYTVKNGDTLWKLAKENYGEGRKYTKIYNANRDGEDGTKKLTDPNVLQAGWTIKIPK